MISSEQLADRMTATARLLESQGPVAWERVSDWTIAGRMPARGERGGGMADGADPLERIDDRREDAAAGRYYDEVKTLAARLEADMARLSRIVGICCPTPPKSLATRDMQLAQVAADGWCVSCWRNDQHLEPIADGRYRDRCRACGDWKGEHGQDPPVPILVLRHSGRRITTAAVAAAMS